MLWQWLPMTPWHRCDRELKLVATATDVTLMCTLVWRDGNWHCCDSDVRTSVTEMAHFSNSLRALRQQCAQCWSLRMIRLGSWQRIQLSLLSRYCYCHCCRSSVDMHRCHTNVACYHRCHSAITIIAVTALSVTLFRSQHYYHHRCRHTTFTTTAVTLLPVVTAVTLLSLPPLSHNCHYHRCHTTNICHRYDSVNVNSCATAVRFQHRGKFQYFFTKYLPKYQGKFSTDERCCMLQPILQNSFCHKIPKSSAVTRP